MKTGGTDGGRGAGAGASNRQARASSGRPGSLLENSWVMAGLLAAIVLVVFVPLCSGGFLDWDDPENLVRNPDMNPPTLASVARYWSPAHPHMDLYIPMTYTTWGLIGSVASGSAALDPRDTGSAHLDPHAFHAANLLLHAAASIAVFFLLRALMSAIPAPPAGSVPGRDAVLPDAHAHARARDLGSASRNLAAAVGAAVFALHPIQVEAVAWVSGLKDVLSGLLALAALGLYVRWAAPGRGLPTSQGSRTGGPALYVLATAAFVLSMLAKPSAVALPLVAGVVDLVVLRRSWSQALRGQAPWLALALPIILIGRVAQAGITTFAAPPVWARPLVALDALAFYMWKLVLPLNLAVDYGRSPDWLMRTPQILFTWIAPVALIVVLSLRRGSRRWALAAAAVFVAALLPVLGLIPFDFQYYSTVADHYLYTAMLGPALATACLVAGRPTRQAGMIACGLLLPLAVLSHVQTYAWTSSAELFQHTLRVNRSSVAAHVNLGLRLWSEGRPADGAAHFAAALEARPQDHEANNDLAGCLADLGRFEEAIAHYRTAVTSGPRDPVVRYNLAIALSRAGRPDEAVREYEEALRLDPGYAQAHTNLGGLLLSRGDSRGAIDHYRAALRIAPDLEPARNGLQQALGSAGGQAPRP